ncbi:MAG: carbon starvation protein A [Lentimicrobiaceae bacterium]|jgi:carbon starvation protein CstA|nr:carbon starvation protein A [Lentimicrobiaceae bacterium]
MITFIISIAILIAGYIIYGKFAERIFGIDTNKKTPAYTMTDNVDYVPMPWWRVFLIQFLNIAGLGPIFGAIMGIMFGTSAFIWIVVGTIFGGAVHDYFSGMMSVRSGGASLPELNGRELGNAAKQFMRVFSLFLMILVGAVFVSGPAGLLAGMTAEYLDVFVWTMVVFAYYILATLLPIDKIIGKIYPFFGAVLLFMAVGILVALFANGSAIPEITDGLQNQHPQHLPIFPMMFVSIACGAISGFHATQSPMMARCIQNEKYGRPCFYGAMVTEGVLALIWAAAAASFFGSIDGLQQFAASLPANANTGAEVVNTISKTWLGTFGGILALLGVVAAPITSGDTALRSARLIAADFLKINQKKLSKRLLVAIPIFALTFVILFFIPFDILWRYFAWCNQTLAVFTLWAITIYLCKRKKNYWISLIPALFMTAVTSTYIFVAPEGLGLAYNLSLTIGLIVTAVIAVVFFLNAKKLSRNFVDSDL